MQGIETMTITMKDEHMINYISSADTSAFRGARWRLRNGLTLADGIYNGRALTVDGGRSVMRYAAPGDGGMSWTCLILMSLLDKSAPANVKARFQECGEKIEALKETALGDEAENMYEIEILGTDPEYQGRGYASALVNTVTDMGDADGHDVWLLTSNAYKFYELLGFSVAGETTVGAEDPTWDQEPVALRLMRRHARSAIKMF
ncbi:hypothetical protein C2E23DRAFT_536704 [Lenzites betulinus]|nr:hypothetical protein C2E23DRAFT_536704 [Lenzites betulinus]